MVDISTYAAGDDTRALHAIWDAGIAGAHRAYALPAAKLHALLNAPSARVFIARDGEKVLGFALTYTIRAGGERNPASQHLRGGLSALVVAPEAWGRGLGSALHDAAVTYLEDAVRGSLARSSPPPKEGVIQLGSAFPRIFPGLPVLPSFQAAKPWLEKRGWTFGTSYAIDLYAALPPSIDQTPFIAKAQDNGVTFRPATDADRAEVEALQYAEFDSYTGWPDMYPVFFDAGRARDIHLAIRGGEIIGATFAAMPGSPAHTALAYPDTLGNACGAVACVGVSAKARGTGAGVGMVAAAFNDLASRGADGVFIDWVSMEGFYERFGAKQWEAQYYDVSRKVLP